MQWKQGEERLGVGSTACPLLCKLSPPLAPTSATPAHTSGRTLEAADKNHLGEATTLLLAMWQVCPVKTKELFRFLP